MTAAPDVIDTVVGPAPVLHRLALGVECLDAGTGRRVRTDVAVGRELPLRLLPQVHSPNWPCITLEPKGIGRAQLRYDLTTPEQTPIRLRLVDPGRRFVPRRFDLAWWQLSEILSADATPTPVPAASRVLRPWLWPASGAILPGGVTVVRGVVREQGTDRPVRWARLTAVRRPPGAGPGDVVGRGHADDRGEFLVVITDTGTLPPPFPRTLPIDLQVIARPPRPDPDPNPPSPDPNPQDPDALGPEPGDGYGDLVVEDLVHPSNPPLPGELDNAVLRGTATPPGYVPNTAAVPTLTVPVGTELSLTTAIPFAP